MNKSIVLTLVILSFLCFGKAHAYGGGYHGSFHSSYHSTPHLTPHFNRAARPSIFKPTMPHSVPTVSKASPHTYMKPTVSSHVPTTSIFRNTFFYMWLFGNHSPSDKAVDCTNKDNKNKAECK